MNDKTNKPERKPLCTVRRAAFLLDCSERTIRRMCEEGSIVAVKLTDSGNSKWRINVKSLCEQFGIEA